MTINGLEGRIVNSMYRPKSDPEFMCNFKIMVPQNMFIISKIEKVRCNLTSNFLLSEDDVFVKSSSYTIDTIRCPQYEAGDMRVNGAEISPRFKAFISKGNVSFYQLVSFQDTSLAEFEIVFQAVNISERETSLHNVFTQDRGVIDSYPTWYKDFCSKCYCLQNFW